jgi:hypothetical protein
MEPTARKFRILVAPLDWGLGHTTRCISVIEELLAHNCEVWMAGEGVQEIILKSEFPDLPFLPLTGYSIRYSKRWFLLNIFAQIPRIVYTIKKEHAWLKKMISIHHFDAVISDNRYGLYSKKIHTVFLTHQLKIKSPLGNWSERMLQQWNYKFINRFSECWIPDFESENNLAGELSHPAGRPTVPVKYVGILSRFKRKQHETMSDHLLFILSGPEPQRTILENKIIDEVSHYPGTAVIVRGLPASLSVIPSTGMIKFYNHLAAEELNTEMQKADWVISRSGYSTVMDIVKLGKKSILIPTPGQTEQEYLASYLMEKQIAFTVSQKKFSLNDSLEKAKRNDYSMSFDTNSNELKTVLKEFLKKLS